jgi:lipopolysaccharide transport system permease protein
VKKLRFPVELLVASSAGAAMVLQLAGLAVLGAFILVSGRGEVRPLALIAALAFELLLLAGPCLLLASLNVFFRDLSQMVPPALMIVMYLTPILYPESLVPTSVAPLLGLNPVRDLVALFRAALFGGGFPPAARLLGWSAAFAGLAFVCHRVFRRSRPVFADLL